MGKYVGLSRSVTVCKMFATYLSKEAPLVTESFSHLQATCAVGPDSPRMSSRPLQRTVLRATAAKDLEPSGTWPDSEVHLGKGVADYGDAP